jgi:hypothetical protein
MNITGNHTIDSILGVLGAVSALAASISAFLPKGMAVFLTRLQALDFRNHVASSVKP